MKVKMKKNKHNHKYVESSKDSKFRNSNKVSKYFGFILLLIGLILLFVESIYLFLCIMFILIGIFIMTDD